MIYFMQPVTGGPVKIGFSTDVEARHRQLEAHYGQPLAILATMPGGREEERQIHERFADLRLGRTEQFRPGSDLMAFIGRPLLVGANPDAVEEMPSKTQPNAITIRGSREWKEWLERFATKLRSKPTAIIDLALAKLAEAEGFDVPPLRMADAGEKGDKP